MQMDIQNRNDAYTALRQTQTRIESMWNEFASSTLVNDDATRSIAGDASFSIDAETTRLRRIEETIRNSLEHVRLLATMSPNSSVRSNRVTDVATENTIAPRVLEPVVIMRGKLLESHFPESSEISTADPSLFAIREGVDDTVHTDDGKSQQTSISALTTDGQTSMTIYSRVTREVLRSLSYAISKISFYLYGSQRYQVLLVNGQMRQRDYQGSLSFFLVLSLVLQNVDDSRGDITPWCSVVASFALTVVEIHLPHSCDERMIAFLLLLLYLFLEM